MLNLTWHKIRSCGRRVGARCAWDVRCTIRTLSWVTWLVKAYYVELDLGEHLELGRKDWDTAHGEGGERVVSLASSIRHIGERCVPTLGGALERDIFFADELNLSDMEGTFL